MPLEDLTKSIFLTSFTYGTVYRTKHNNIFDFEHNVFG